MTLVKRVDKAEAALRERERAERGPADALEGVRLWLNRVTLNEEEAARLAAFLADPPPGLKLYEGVNLLDVV